MQPSACHSTDPGQLPLLASVLGRGTAAALLVGAGVVALRPTPDVAWRPALLLVVPAATVALMIVLAARIQDGLPMLVDASTLAEIARHPAAVLPTGSAWSLVVAQLLVGFGFATAAVLAHRSWRRNGRVGEALLAAGLMIAAFSQVSSAIHPGSYTSVVTTGDLMRLAFYVVLLIGFVFDSRDDLRALREANIELRRLGDAELANAALEERARLAREIHDGLAQDLWFAKLKHSRLAQIGRVRAGGEAAERRGRGRHRQRAGGGAPGGGRHAPELRDGAAGRHAGAPRGRLRGSLRAARGAENPRTGAGDRSPRPG